MITVKFYNYAPMNVINKLKSKKNKEIPTQTQVQQEERKEET